MRLFITFLMSILPLAAVAGEWTRVDRETIQLVGKIEVTEYAKFKGVFDSQVKRLIVNSGGGETSAALQIANDIKNAGLTIEVNNWCLSSCANYLFTAARTKLIKNGIVGFHGNVQACFGEARWPEVVEHLKKQGLTEAMIEDFRKNIRKQIVTEAKFLTDVGVAQALYDRTCMADKGMNDGKEYAFLLPLPDTFARYGLTGIKGEQDLEVVRRFPAPLAID